MLGKHRLKAGAFILGLVLAVGALDVTAQNADTNSAPEAASRAVQSQTVPATKNPTTARQSQTTRKVGGPTQYPRYRFGHRAKLH